MAEGQAWILTLRHSVFRCAVALFPFVLVVTFARGEEPATVSGVQLMWDQKIPMRDGIELSSVIWKPRGLKSPLPAIVTITPYGAARTELQAMFFAHHGYVVVSVDSRGRGDSGGTFRPFRDDGQDGYDVIEWVARQPWCNGKVGSWGGSYAGFIQWATMKYRPSHLATAIPFASGGVISDIPMANNIVPAYLLTWLALVSGKTPNNDLANDDDFWDDAFREVVREGKSFRQLDEVVGNTSTAWKEMLDHPTVDNYWLSMIPGPEDYAKIDIPILTITGHYDMDQGGAMRYYREFMSYASADAKAKHYLIIGPWDHHGTLFNKDQVGSVKFGPNSVLDMIQIHLAWYNWMLKGEELPRFLKDKVAYYIAPSDEWKYASSLSGISNGERVLFLGSDRNRSHDAYHAGYLSDKPAENDAPDSYESDPRNLKAFVEEKNPELYFYTDPLSESLTISGVVTLEAYIAIDQKDADFLVRLEEVQADGTAIPLADDKQRARYRKSLLQEELIEPNQVNKYVFATFRLFSRQIAKGSRLRLVFSTLNSPDYQRNVNTGGRISDDTIKDGKPVKVMLYHNSLYPSRLLLPVLSVPEDKH